MANTKFSGLMSLDQRQQRPACDIMWLCFLCFFRRCLFFNYVWLPKVRIWDMPSAWWRSIHYSKRAVMFPSIFFWDLLRGHVGQRFASSIVANWCKSDATQGRDEQFRACGRSAVHEQFDSQCWRPDVHLIDPKQNKKTCWRVDVD